MHARVHTARRRAAEVRRADVPARARPRGPGGFDVPSVFGSRATSLISRMGPFGGRALKAGDVLPDRAGTTRRDPGAGEPAVFRCRSRAAARGFASSLGPQDRMFTTPGVRDVLRVALRRHARVQSHGIPARGSALDACRSRRHPVGRDADRIAPGAGVRPAHPADGRSTDDRRLSEDRDGHQRGSSRSPVSSRRATGSSSLPCTRRAAVDALKLARRELRGVHA